MKRICTIALTVTEADLADIEASRGPLTKSTFCRIAVREFISRHGDLRTTRWQSNGATGHKEHRMSSDDRSTSPLNSVTWMRQYVS
jgi:hypothetical protein